jgi:hypothetical protein
LFCTPYRYFIGDARVSFVARPMTRLTLMLSLLVDLGIAPWVLLAARAMWLLPDWVIKWLDVRDRREGPPP